MGLSKPRENRTFSGLALDDNLSSMRDFGGNDAQATNMIKLAEARALLAGTTIIQGASARDDEYAHQGIFINNAERFPSRIHTSVFPLSTSASAWQNRIVTRSWFPFPDLTVSWPQV